MKRQRKQRKNKRIRSGIACPTGKVPYSTEAAAERAKEEVETVARKRGGKRPQRTYRCDECNEWHYTSMSEGAYRSIFVDLAQPVDCLACNVPTLTATCDNRPRVLNWAPHPSGPYAAVDGRLVWDPDHLHGAVQRHHNHQCVYGPSRCKYCQRDVLVLNMDPATPPERFSGEWLTVVDVEEAVDGLIRMTDDGWARWRDPHESWGYRWHTKH